MSEIPLPPHLAREVRKARTRARVKIILSYVKAGFVLLSVLGLLAMCIAPRSKHVDSESRHTSQQQSPPVTKEPARLSRAQENFCIQVLSKLNEANDFDRERLLISKQQHKANAKLIRQEFWRCMEKVK